MHETTLVNEFAYCDSLTEYRRRKTVEVRIGDIPVGGDNPIRIQSMTTVDTMDTEGSIAQAIRMIEAGSEYVRLTAPSLKEAQNLEVIKKGLRERGYKTPLVADIHFTPNAAELAARIVEKVRINPGNYADKKKFQQLEYDDASYDAEIDRIRSKFSPLVEICKEYGTAMRIGTNHGSLSDRIMSRYGDTPLGMVESALEFLRICDDLSYHEIVLSMKASNPQVMVQAYRLLVQKMDQEGLRPYPLHLGVTEAGEGEDGRIKSAMGIGTLLEDGLGDTIRVSLTEEPELELPVARLLVDRYINRPGHREIPHVEWGAFNPFSFQRRVTNEVVNVGGDNVPRVIADFSAVEELHVKDLASIGHFYLPEPDKWAMNETGADYIYLGTRKAPFMLPNGLKQVIDHDLWLQSPEDAYPLIPLRDWPTAEKHDSLNFVASSVEDLREDVVRQLSRQTDAVLVLETENPHAMASLRQVFTLMRELQCKVPVIIRQRVNGRSYEELQLHASTDVGGLMLDGFGDGIMLSQDKERADVKTLNELCFGILQGARLRITKTEYISCPSCGRTLFDLQETTALIRKRTDHLKGVKIGIMGCIVNGPGEMADADFGYVGSGVDKITLYRGKEVVKRAVPSNEAVDALIDLIKEEGMWVDP